MPPSSVLSSDSRVQVGLLVVLSLAAFGAFGAAIRGTWIVAKELQGANGRLERADMRLANIEQDVAELAADNVSRSELQSILHVLGDLNPDLRIPSSWTR